MYFSEVLATFHRAIEPRTYVQLGLDHPSLLSLAQCGSVAVAPAPRVVSGVHAGKPWLKLFDLPRDQFFAGEDRSATLEGDPLDLVVIDGGSLTQIASDLDGLVAWSHPGTVVLVLPPGDDREGLSLLAHAASDLLPHGVLRFVAAEPSPMLMLARFDAAGRNRPRFAEAIQAGPQQAARSQGIAPVSVEQAIDASRKRRLGAEGGKPPQARTAFAIPCRRRRADHRSGPFDSPCVPGAHQPVPGGNGGTARQLSQRSRRWWTP